MALVECGTRALLGAAFGPDTTGELGYARRLLDHLDASMVLLADAYYDAFDFLQTVTDTGASFLLRSTRKRRPAVRRPLPDGSYLTAVCAGKYKAGRGYGRLEVRIVEAWMTVTLGDDTRRTELWRLMTSLLDAERYPAHEHGLLPTRQRQRLKAHVRKRNSKYTFTAGKHPRTAQPYTLHFEMITQDGFDDANRG
ncbi:hypothetical protein [Streptomyces cavernae]|uniref:hypothetical protein n=1 Tax=Streptomyces cavernae TaxID=2259034 RepID=UPI000FEC0C26|nr:hypothetical protein [Streptomyces cavernae]